MQIKLSNFFPSSKNIFLAASAKLCENGKLRKKIDKAKENHPKKRKNRL